MNMYTAFMLTHTYSNNTQTKAQAYTVTQSQRYTLECEHTHILYTHTHTRSSEPSHCARWQEDALGWERAERRRRGSWPALKARGTNGSGDAQVWMRPGEPWRGFLGMQAGRRGGLLGHFLGCFWAVVSPLCNREVWSQTQLSCSEPDLLVHGPRAAAGTGMLQRLRLGLHTPYCSRRLRYILNKTYLFLLSCVCSMAGLGQTLC